MAVETSFLNLRPISLIMRNSSQNPFLCFLRMLIIVIIGAYHEETLRLYNDYWNAHSLRNRNPNDSQIISTASFDGNRDD